MGGGATKHAKEPAKDVGDDEEFNPIHPDAKEEGGNSMSQHQSVRRASRELGSGTFVRTLTPHEIVGQAEAQVHADQRGVREG